MYSTFKLRSLHFAWQQITQLWIGSRSSHASRQTSFPGLFPSLKRFGNIVRSGFSLKMPESAADHGRIQNFLFWEPNLGGMLSEANNFHP